MRRERKIGGRVGGATLALPAGELISSCFRRLASALRGGRKPEGRVL